MGISEIQHLKNLKISQNLRKKIILLLFLTRINGGVFAKKKIMLIIITLYLFFYHKQKPKQIEAKDWNFSAEARNPYHCYS
jgi:hypothetical protein